MKDTPTPIGVWHYHHAKYLVEFPTESIESRHAFTDSDKDPSERLLRHRLLKQVMGDLPAALVQAYQAWEQAYQARRQAYTRHGGKPTRHGGKPTRKIFLQSRRCINWSVPIVRGTVKLFSGGERSYPCLSHFRD